MFDMVALDAFNGVVDVAVDIIANNKICKEYDLSSERRSRKLTVGGNIDIKNQVVDVCLRYKSNPKK